MPDPKKKKSLNDLVVAAGNEVLGQNESPTTKTSMSDEELLAAFGGTEKKKDSPQTTSGPPQPIQEKPEEIVPFGENFKPEQKKYGTGSSSQSEPKDNGIGMAMSAMAKINQHFYDFPAQLAETSAILGAQIEKVAPFLGSGNPEDNILYQAAQKYRNYIKEISPTNPKIETEDPYYSHTIAGSAGDLMALITSAGTSRGSQAINQLSQASIKSAVAPLIVKSTKEFVTNPSVLTGAMQMGTSEWEQAKAAGATDDQAFEVFYKNATVGSLMESIPVMHFFKRLDNLTGGGVKQAIAKGATQGVEEMSTEVAQQYYSNYTAAETYDATRKLTDGMQESGGIGFGLGFVLGAMGVSLRKKQEVAKTPEEKAEIQKALDLVNQKSSDLKDGKLNDQGEEIKTDEAPAKEPVPETTEEAADTVADNKAIEQQPEDITTQPETIPEQTNIPEENVQIDTSVDQTTPLEETASPQDLTQSEEITNTELPQNTDTQENIPQEESTEINTQEENNYNKENDIDESQPIFYHATTKENADKIRENGFKKEYNVNITTDLSEAEDYAKMHEDDGDQSEIIKVRLKKGVNPIAENGIDSNAFNANDVALDYSETKKTADKETTILEQNIIEHVKEGKNINDYKSEFDNSEDFETVKEYIDDKIKSDNPVTGESQEVEKTKTEGTEGGGIVGTIRDKSERLRNTDQPEEKIKLAEEIVSDVDNYLKTNPEVLSEKETNKKDRRFAQQVLKNPDLSDEIKRGLSEEGRKYIPITNKLTIKEATALIDEKGIEQSTEDFTNKSNGLHPAVRTMMGELLINKYNKLASEATNAEEKNKHIDQAIKVADDLSIHLTSLGQAIQAAAVFSRLSPEGVVRAIEKEFKKTKKKKLAQLSTDINATESEINKINSEAIEEVLSGKVKNIISDKSKKQAGEKRKKAVKQAVDFLESIKIKTKGNTLQEASLFAIPVAYYNGAITTIQVSLKAGDMIATAIEKGIKYIKNNHKGEWKEDDLRKDLTEKLSSYDQLIDPKKIVENEIKDAEINISELIKKHFTEVEKTKKSLTDKLVSESGLSDQDAKELSSEIQKEFDKIATRRKREYLNKKISSIEKALLPKKAKQKQQLYEKIIELTNTQTLTHKEFEDLYSDYFDLPKLTPQQTQKLTELSGKVQSANGAEAKNKATQDLLKYQESLNGINYADVGMAIWYANILSGLSTQTMNVYANFAETAGEAYTSILQDPKKANQLMIGLFQGYGKGILAAIDVLKTGYSPVKNNKIDTQNILERYTLPGGAWNPYNYLKYVSRIMSAADIFAYSGLKEMRSQQLAMSMAMKEGKERPTHDIEKRANEILYNTKERVAEATAKATEEGLTGSAKQRRIFELIEESRPESITEDAIDFASQGTFNYDPVGTMGALTQGINHISNIVNIKGVRPVSFVVPFTRIIANVTNRYLDWTPWGLVRAAKGGVGYNNPIYGDRFAKKYTPEERQREFIKAITGTTAMAALYALTEPDDEGESAIEITADGTGNYKKNYELQQTGWRPYSVKINDKWYEYKNTPLAIPFAWIGQIRDAQKYKGEKSLGDKLSIMLYGSAKYLMDMSFLSALSDFFTAFSKDQAEGASFLDKATKSTARTGKSFILPNLYTQLARSYEEIGDMPMKQAKTVGEELIRDMPVLRDNLNNMYNALGEPVYPDQNRKYVPFKVSQEDSDKVWDMIVDNQAWIGAPSKSQKIYDPILKGERTMSEEEYYKYSILAGQKTKERILENYDSLIKMENMGDVQDRIKEIKEKARKSAKFEIVKKLHK